MPSAFLIDRAFIHVSGTGAMEFLQNLVTPDLESLPEGEARAGALLTPQGKIMFEFLIWREGDGYVLETGADQQDALLRRLTMYKLRACGFESGRNQRRERILGRTRTGGRDQG